MRLNDLNRFKVFATSLLNAVALVAAHTIHIMRPGGQKSIVAVVKVIYRLQQVLSVCLCIIVFIQQLRNQQLAVMPVKLIEAISRRT